MSNAPAPDAVRLVPALDAIASERRRQIEDERFTFGRDDQYELGELGLAAALYALPYDAEIAGEKLLTQADFIGLDMALSIACDFKLKPEPNKRRRLVKAGALIVAEIERLDRASGAAAPAPATARGGWDVEHDLAKAAGFGASFSREDLKWHLYSMPGAKPFGAIDGYDKASIDFVMDALRGHLAALASQPQATGGAVEREVIARIIDPKGWETRDRQYREIEAEVAMHGKDRPLAFSNADYFTRESLATADAILAAIATQPAPSPGEAVGMRWREKGSTFWNVGPLGYFVTQNPEKYEIETLYALPAAPSIHKGDEG